ncbi:MAG: hypothetical protein WC360_05055 [Opitutales bacterium]|jgi:hypothetical protein
MSWLLFLDESGHDHKSVPYEIHGGIALHDSKLWSFVRSIRQLELDCFGAQLSLYKHELKGSAMLDKKRMGFAGQAPVMLDGQGRVQRIRSSMRKNGRRTLPDTLGT